MKWLSKFKKMPVGLTVAMLTLVCWTASAAVACPADVDGNGNVGFADLTQVLGAWGPCDGCATDLDGNGNVGFADLTQVLGAWGPCPAGDCAYNDECPAGEYCAGDGCGAGTDWFGPLPQGICTPMPDPSECIDQPLEPVCSCTHQFYITVCDLAANGERWRTDGLCPQVFCPGGDADCPPNQHCQDGGGTIPSVCLPN